MRCMPGHFIPESKGIRKIAHGTIAAACKECACALFKACDDDVGDGAQPKWQPGKKKDNKKIFFAGARASARPSKVVKLRWGARRFLNAVLALALVFYAVIDAFSAFGASRTVDPSLSASSKPQESFGGDFPGIQRVGLFLTFCSK